MTSEYWLDFGRRQEIKRESRVTWVEEQIVIRPSFIRFHESLVDVWSLDYQLLAISPGSASKTQRMNQSCWPGYHTGYQCITCRIIHAGNWLANKQVTTVLCEPWVHIKPTVNCTGSHIGMKTLYTAAHYVLTISCFTPRVKTNFIDWANESKAKKNSFKLRLLTDSCVPIQISHNYFGVN